MSTKQKIRTFDFGELTPRQAALKVEQGTDVYVLNGEVLGIAPKFKYVLALGPLSEQTVFNDDVRQRTQVVIDLLRAELNLMECKVDGYTIPRFYLTESNGAAVIEGITDGRRVGITIEFDASASNWYYVCLSPPEFASGMLSKLDMSSLLMRLIGREAVLEGLTCVRSVNSAKGVNDVPCDVWTHTGDIRVILTKDGDGWFAQGLELDYAAEGDTLETAIENFVDGLNHTVQHHVKSFGNPYKLVKSAPPEAWVELCKSRIINAKHRDYAGVPPFCGLTFIQLEDVQHDHA